MKYRNLLFGLGVLITLGFFSCSQDELPSLDKIKDEDQTLVLEKSGVGDRQFSKEMLPFYKECKTRSIDDINFMNYTGDLPSIFGNRNREVKPIIDLKLSFIVVGNFGDKKILTWNDTNNRVTFEPIIENKEKNITQEFSIEEFPGYGGGYIIYTIKNDIKMMCTLGKSGDNKEDLLLLVDYETNKNKLEFCRWNFLGIVGEDHRDFVIENNDYIEEIENPTKPWENFYRKVLAINTSNGKLEYAKYIGGNNQKFRIIVSEDLILEDLTFHEDALQNVTQAPDFYFMGHADNNAPDDDQFTLSTSKKATETSQFSETKAYKVTFSEKANLDFTLSDKISLGGEIGSTQEITHTITFGKNETTEFNTNYTYTLKCPPYSTVDARIIVKRYKGSLTYDAILRGIKSGNYYYISGVWEGVLCMSVNITRTVTSLKTEETKENIKTFNRKEALDKNNIPTLIDFDNMH